jgi:hypothetical protein
MTPTTSWTTPLARIVLPMMALSPPKRFCQMSQPMMATGWSPWPVVVFGKQPSPKWLNPEQLESGRGDEPALETLRSPLQPAYVDRSLGPGGEVLEALLLLRQAVKSLTGTP